MKRLLKDKKGATAIEYGLIASLISIVSIGAMTLTGQKLSCVYDEVADSLSGSSIRSCQTSPVLILRKIDPPQPDDCHAPEGSFCL